MVFNEGDKVFWIQHNWKGDRSERAGTVIAVCPAEVHPLNLGLGSIVSPNVSARNEVSYFIKTPSSNVLFWVTKCFALTPENSYILEEQRKVTVAPRSVNKTDRYKIKQWLRRVDAEFTESNDAIHILSSGKRLWFAVTAGVEHIEKIERIKLL